LEQLGVTRAVVHYDGYGDTGQIDGLFEDIHAEPAPAGGIPRWVEDGVAVLDDHFLPGGWVVDQGSYGQLTLDVQTRQVEIEHNARHDDSQADAITWDLNTLRALDAQPEEHGAGA
jgi:hypothetical protein